MAIVLLYPGQQGPLVSLQECLRQAHDDLRASRDQEIADRKRHHAPLDDETHWGEVREFATALALAVEVQDTVTVTEKARAIAARVEGNAIERLPEYQPDPNVDGIMVRHVVISDAARRDLLARLSDGWRAIRDAHLADAPQTQIRALDEVICQAQEDFVAATVCELIDDDGNRHVDIPPMIPALRRSGLLGPLFRSSQAFQALPPKKVMRFGSSALPTSGVTTTAPDAGINGAAS